LSTLLRVSSDKLFAVSFETYWGWKNNVCECARIVSCQWETDDTNASEPDMADGMCGYQPDPDWEPVSERLLMC